jgi:tRNA U34 5-methylaminomethyl-2-thiouridine-forming methyltransferase MnmC
MHDRPVSARTNWLPQPTRDGSFTFFSEEFGEAFHSRLGAKTEAFLKFVQATDLIQKAQQPPLRLLDVCYGLGYNSAAAMETIWRVNPTCHIELYGLELDATVPRSAILPPLIDTWSPTVQVVLKTIALNHHCTTPTLSARLLIGDARQTIRALKPQGFQADAIFFDPFSPRCCPQLWTVEFFTAVSHCLAPNGKLATYSRAAAVRSAMLAAGLCIGTIPITVPHLPHAWSEGTIGAFDATTLHPLSRLEQEHLQTRAAIPYRDPQGCDSAEVILQRHQAEQQHCQLESTSRWRRRWGIH